MNSQHTLLTCQTVTLASVLSADWLVQPSRLLPPANQQPCLLLRGNEVVDAAVTLQPLLHGDEQFDAVHHQLGQRHLARAEGRRVAHTVQRRGFWEVKGLREHFAVSCLKVTGLIPAVETNQTPQAESSTMSNIFRLFILRNYFVSVSLRQQLLQRRMFVLTHLVGEAALISSPKSWY